MLEAARMTEQEFMKGLKTLLQFYPQFTLEITSSEGDIVIKRKEKPETSERSRVLAAAFQGIMKTDSKTPRGGGWL